MTSATATAVAKRIAKAQHPCIWPGCPVPGKHYTGRMNGLGKEWGYACSEHERAIAYENLDRARREGEPCL